MGTCRIIIESTGPHHNSKDFDLDALARNFVQRLRESGHRVEIATLEQQTFKGYEGETAWGRRESL